MMLDLNTTRYYLSCYGTDVSRWPEPEAGKTALAVYAKELGDALTQEQRLDSALSNIVVNSPSELLERRIMDNLPAQSGVPANDSHKSAGFNWRSMTASILVLGVIGFSAFSTQTVTEDQVWREAALDLGVDDVYDWVYADDA